MAVDLKELRAKSQAYKDWQYWGRQKNSSPRGSVARDRAETKQMEAKAKWLKEKEDAFYVASGQEKVPATPNPTSFALHYIWHPAESGRSRG